MVVVQQHSWWLQLQDGCIIKFTIDCIEWTHMHSHTPLCGTGLNPKTEVSPVMGKVIALVGK